MGEAIQEIWRRELGVEVTLVTREWQSFFGTMLEGDFDLAAVAWNADYIDPSSFLEVFLSQGGNNFTGWANSRYDELLAQARAALDPAARRDLYHQAEELLLAEMPAIPLFFPVRHYLQVEDLKGVYFTPWAWWISKGLSWADSEGLTRYEPPGGRILGEVLPC